MPREPTDEGPDRIPDGPVPQDLDGDGLYEDVDGDGEFTLDDVELFYQAIYLERDSEYVQTNTEYFDFDGDGRISLGDVHELMELQSQRE